MIYDGDKAFVADRKAKLHKPFIYTGGWTGILFKEPGHDNDQTPCIL